MDVEVIRSSKRRKTVSARVVNGILRVSVPDTLTRAEEQLHVDDLRRRIERKRAANQVDLTARAEQLARRLGLAKPTSIRWVDNQQWRWGSCTPEDGSIRVSSRLSREPGWVLDYVIVHELAHLDVAGHGPAFWRLVDRYPKAERARGFLMARSLTPPEGEGGEGRPPPPGNGEDPSDDPWCDPPAIPLGPGG